jgi:hypothetical protein
VFKLSGEHREKEKTMDTNTHSLAEILAGTFGLPTTTWWIGLAGGLIEGTVRPVPGSIHDAYVRSELSQEHPPALDMTQIRQIYAVAMEWLTAVPPNDEELRQLEEAARTAADAHSSAMQMVTDGTKAIRAAEPAWRADMWAAQFRLERSPGAASAMAEAQRARNEGNRDVERLGPEAHRASQALYLARTARERAGMEF